MMPKKLHVRLPKARMHHQHGMTLVELLVAMALGLLIAIAAATALLVSRQGFTTVDSASQLRDNSRFVRDVLQRLIVQSGYKDVLYASTAGSVNTAGLDPNPPPNVFGINNASRTTTALWDAGTPRTTSTDLGYGSDILVLRYQTSTFNATSTTADGTMIDCSGAASTVVATDRNDRLVSILHVGISGDGEPSLMCSRSATGAAPYTSQPLIRGVENFQVLYGVDGIAPGNTIVPIPPSTADSVPERYLRADQLTVAGNALATYANWSRVRSVRIGMVLRGPPNSAAEKASQTYYPFGEAKGSSGGTVGSAYASTNDPGTIFTPALDGRLRQTLTFTVHLRNFQEDN